MKLGSAFVCFAAAISCVWTLAEEVSVNVEKAVVITFPSQNQRTYKVLGADTAGGPWRSLQEGIAGTGGEVTVFYKSETDQKLFFKVETAEGSPARQSFLSVARLNLSAQNFTGQQLAGEDFKLFTLTGTIFEDANLRGANLAGASAGGANFAGADLRGVLTDGNTVLTGATFLGANLEGTRFQVAGLDDADFRNAKLGGAVFYTSVANSDFRGATLNGAVFVFANLSVANFANQNLSNVAFRYCNFYYANLSGANLAGADLSRCYMRFSNLDGAILTNVNLEATMTEAVPFAGRDVRGALLRGMVPKSDWAGINATGVDGSMLWMEGGSLAGANFSGGNLEGAILNGANLSGANLRNTKLRGTELRGADLRNVDFTGADLSFADVSGANLAGATGFNAGQPGMQFSSSQTAYYGGGGGGGTQGTVLPDGTTRTGRNPGTGLASATTPGKLRWNLNDYGATSTRELTFNGDVYSEPGQTGSFTYTAKDDIAVLGLSSAYYTLLFTSPTQGKLFKNVRNGTAGVFLVGTFTVVP